MTEREAEPRMVEAGIGGTPPTGRRVSLIGGSILGALGVLGVGLALFQTLSLADADPSTSADSGLLQVQVAPLEAVSQYQREIAYTGTVRARRTTQVAFERPGRVSEVLVDEGSFVEEGQALAKLDSDKLAASRRELVAQLKQAQAIFDEAQAGPRQQAIAQAEQRVVELEADASLAEISYNRIAQLRRSETINQQELDQATFQLQASRARLESARLDLDLLREGTRQEQIDAAQASVERLEAQLAELDLQIEDCTLTAPFAGKVTRRAIDEGAIVAAGANAIELAETGQLEVWMGIPVEVAPNLPEGSVTKLEILGREYQAHVSAQLPQLNSETRTRTIVLRLENDANLASFPPPLAELARLEVSFTEQASGFWVPLDAMTRGPRGLWTVLVAEPIEGSKHRVARINVETLHSQTDRAFVRGPLSDQALLIQEGAHRVTPGQFVLVASPEATTQADASGTSSSE